MSYVENNLIYGESIVYRARLHWLILLFPVAMAVILTILGAWLMIAGWSGEVVNSWLITAGLLFILIAFLFTTSGLLRRRFAECAITNKRVIFKTGVMQRKTAEMFLQKVESVGVEQGLAGRMFNYGTIVLRGTGGTTEPFPRISKPLEFRRRVQQQIGQMLERGVSAGA